MNLDKLTLNINRGNWRLVKFGDIAIQQKKTVDRGNTELTRYVKGEHMQSEDLHLREWGELTDEYLGPAFIRKFETGDILYGSRRTYLRKVLVAPFEGITSNTTFVIKADEQMIDQRLLPYLMLSEGFAQHSIRNSKGSVNPYVNWKDLAGYEFLVPSKSDQALLVDLLSGINGLIEEEKNLLKSLRQFKDSVMRIYLNGYNLTKNINQIPPGWTIKKIQELGVVSTSSVDKKSNINEKQINLLNYMDVYTSKDKKIDSRINFMKVSANENQLIKNQLYKGDVLFTPSSETSDDIGHSCVVYEDLTDTLYSYHLVRLSFNTDIDIDLDFKRFMFNNPIILNEFSLRSKGATRMTLSLNDFNQTEIRIPPIELQKNISAKISAIIENELEQESKVKNLEKIQKSLINAVF